MEHASVSRFNRSPLGQGTLQKGDSHSVGRRPGSERASDVCDTQAEAIERAREIDPNAAIHVERVRNTNRGSRDK